MNGYSQIDVQDSAVYLDDPRYRPFWAEFVALGVPFYLHPREPLPSQSKIYDGHPWLLGSAWAFNVETATHALRLMGSADVDRAGHPVARLTNPPAVWQEPELTRTHRWGRRQYQEWFEALKAARHGFRVAARRDLGFDEDL